MKPKRISRNKKLRAYIIGLAIGDGNLSNPNKRAVRLRITCDIKYPKLIKNITGSIKKLLPDNKVSVVFRKNDGCIDVSSYSNYWEDVLGWRSSGGSKIRQKVKVPFWIKESKLFSKKCLRGLLQTDGSIYKDRNYKMVNFVTYIPSLACDVLDLIKFLGYKPNIQKIVENNKIKHTIRISKYVDKFIKDINLWKN